MATTKKLSFYTNINPALSVIYSLSFSLWW